MGIKRIDDKTGEELSLPYYRLHVIIDRVETQDVNGVPEKTVRAYEAKSDLTLESLNPVIEAAGHEFKES